MSIIKVISFNIRCADDKNGHTRDERAPRLMAAIKSRDPDVIGIQEFIPKWEVHFEDGLSADYEMFNKYRCEKWVEGTPIFWKRDKFDCLKRGYFWLSDTPEVMSDGWDNLGYKRICTYAVLRFKESCETFTFMNTHFGFGDECQVKSARLIYEYALKISDYPTFITGDFNMTPESLGYAEMTKNFVDLNAVTAKDSRPTYHDYKPEEGTGQHIDYCFYRAGAKGISRERIDDTFDGRFPSDHYGLNVELEIN